MDWAFIVLTYCATQAHTKVLGTCLRSINTHYPKRHVYLLDDHSPLHVEDLPEVSTKLKTTVSVHKTKHPKAGEVNPYLFALSSECFHNYILFIHDTTCVKEGIDGYLPQSTDISILWYSKQFVFSDTFVHVNDDILHSLMVRGKPMKDILESYVANPTSFFVTFGGMSLFTKEFVKKMTAVSNIEDVAHKFQVRVNRCLWERVLTALIFAVYGEDWCVPTLFGDIQLHPKAFQNKDPNVRYWAPIVKVWEGR